METLKSNTTWCKCTTIIHTKCQVMQHYFFRSESERSRLMDDSSVIDRTDSTGIRFYLGDKPREHDLGYLTVGADSSPLGIAIPPRADRFVIDSYCPAIATAVGRMISSLHNDHRLIFVEIPLYGYYRCQCISSYTSPRSNRLDKDHP